MTSKKHNWETFDATTATRAEFVEFYNSLSLRERDLYHDRFNSLYGFNSPDDQVRIKDIYEDEPGYEESLLSEEELYRPDHELTVYETIKEKRFESSFLSHFLLGPQRLMTVLFIPFGLFIGLWVWGTLVAAIFGMTGLSEMSQEAIYYLYSFRFLSVYFVLAVVGWGLLGRWFYLGLGDNIINNFIFHTIAVVLWILLVISIISTVFLVVMQVINVGGQLVGKASDWLDS